MVVEPMRQFGDKGDKRVIFLRFCADVFYGRLQKFKLVCKKIDLFGTFLRHPDYRSTSHLVIKHLKKFLVVQNFSKAFIRLSNPILKS